MREAVRRAAWRGTSKSVLRAWRATPRPARLATTDRRALQQRMGSVFDAPRPLPMLSTRPQASRTEQTPATGPAFRATSFREACALLAVRVPAPSANTVRSAAPTPTAPALPARTCRQTEYTPAPASRATLEAARWGAALAISCRDLSACPATPRRVRQASTDPPAQRRRMGNVCHARKDQFTRATSPVGSRITTTRAIGAASPATSRTARPARSAARQPVRWASIARPARPRLTACARPAPTSRPMACSHPLATLATPPAARPPACPAISRSGQHALPATPRRARSESIDRRAAPPQTVSAGPAPRRQQTRSTHPRASLTVLMPAIGNAITIFTNTGHRALAARRALAPTANIARRAAPTKTACAPLAPTCRPTASSPAQVTKGTPRAARPAASRAFLRSARPASPATHRRARSASTGARARRQPTGNV